MNPERQLVFVYGTLRSGGTHHFRMAGADFIAAGTIKGKMYRMDWYPGLVLDADGGKIFGEIYVVGPDLLATLDEFEGLSAGEIEGSEYRRVLTRVDIGTAASAFQMAWVWEWLGPVDEMLCISSGDWLAVAADEPR